MARDANIALALILALSALSLYLYPSEVADIAGALLGAAAELASEAAGAASALVASAR